MMHILALLIATAQAAPPAPGSDDALAVQGHEAWIEAQVNAYGLYSREHWAEGDDAWHLVPDSAILAQPSPIVDAIVWFYRGEVWCVALPASS